MEALHDEDKAILTQFTHNEYQKTMERSRSRLQEEASIDPKILKKEIRRTRKEKRHQYREQVKRRRERRKEKRRKILENDRIEEELRNAVRKEWEIEIQKAKKGTTGAKGGSNNKQTRMDLTTKVMLTLLVLISVPMSLLIMEKFTPIQCTEVVIEQDDWTDHSMIEDVENDPNRTALPEVPSTTKSLLNTTTMPSTTTTITTTDSNIDGNIQYQNTTMSQNK
ncbi:uncharacterized protein LOC120341027 [Styela clava]